MLMADGITSCLAVLASICLNGEASVDIRDSSIWSGAIIRYRGTAITSETYSDNMLLPYSPETHRHCSRRTCLSYQGHCGDAGTQYTCTLWYSFNRAMPLRKVTVTGDRGAVTSAMGQLRLVRSADVLVRLSAFRYDAPDDLPPLCRVRPAPGSRSGRLERRCD